MSALYAVNQYPIQILLLWAQAGEIAIPEYEVFLKDRQRLMAKKLKEYYE